MAAVVPHKGRIRTFRGPKEFEAWLRVNHDKEPELWIKIHKKASGESIVPQKKSPRG